MAYSHREAQWERTEAIEDALAREDGERLLDLADQAKGEGEDELAEFLRKEGKRIQREEMLYDESIGN